jgi:hypothetical protein
MNLALLGAGLALPWLAGYSLLRALRQRTGNSPASDIAHGLLLGLALLQATVILVATRLGGFQPWTVAGILLLVTAAALYWARQTDASGPARQHIGLSSPTATRGQSWPLALLLGWAELHLSLVAVELWYRPLFAWDGWASWLYRAKAWYLTGELLEMIAPGAAPLPGADITYAVEGHHYPRFLPILALWSATLLGQWSDTLVNLPNLLCGLALALGLYAQLRARNSGVLLAAVGAYAVLSLPLLGTHLALAGMADVWMAGFAGLGFVALLRGVLENRSGQVLLGFALLALGTAVKLEGIVWLNAGLLFYLLARRPRKMALVLAAALALALLLWAVGIHALRLPLLGLVGVEDGKLHLPLLGSYPLQIADVRGSYLTSLLLNGSWHLLWPLLLLGQILLLVHPQLRPLRWPLSAFLLVLVLTQMTIFGLSEASQWARDQTAINRLPLQLTPALIFWLLVLVQRLLQAPAAEGRGGWPMQLAPVLAAVVTLAGAVLYLQAGSSTAGGGDKRLFSAADLRPVVGGAALTAGERRLGPFSNGIVILSSGRLALPAADFGLLQVAKSAEQQTQPGFFWRTASDPDNVTTVTLPAGASALLDLQRQPAWQGTITELGLVFYDDPERELRFRQLSLEALQGRALARLVWQEWTLFEPWAQTSLNWIAGGAQKQRLALPALLAAWIVLAFALSHAALLLTRQGAGTRLPGPWLVVLLAWLLLDARWTVNSGQQALATVAEYGTASRRDFIALGQDQPLADFIHSARGQLGPAPATVLVTALRPQLRFEMLRARYHLLPHAGRVQTALDAVTGPADYVLVVKPLALAPGERLPTAAALGQRLGARLGARLEVLEDAAVATLYQVHRTGPAG